MRYLALATDYDGTLADDGQVREDAWQALSRLRESGRKVVLVTGRTLDDLERIMPNFDAFDRIVAENGALLYTPRPPTERRVAEPPPREFVTNLRLRGVEPIATGRVIVATTMPYEKIVLATIRDQGLELEVIFNKGAVMVLPTGVNKASGVKAALGELGIARENVVGVGDAENDHSLLGACGLGVAVANAVPALAERADLVMTRSAGRGVIELCEQLIATDLAHVKPRHRAGGACWT